MTATVARPPAADQPAPARPAPPRPAARSDRVLVLATATVAIGVLLTMLPFRSVFTDWVWFTTSIVCALPYWLIVGAFRMRFAPTWWHSVLGIAASVLMLLWVFVPQHLGYGVLPNPTAVTDIRDLIRDANQIMQIEHAPIASTHSLRLLTCSAMVLLVALTDVLGVLLRRPLLAAAPLLEVLAVASATSGKAAHPVWFSAAAAGFLLILLSGTRLQDRAWGPSVDGSAGRLGGARRIAIAGIVAALVLPLALPSVSVNLLARAAHHDSGNGVGSGGNDGTVELRNLASLQGSLVRSDPVDLFKVQITPNGVQPFYVRQTVLDSFSNANGWVPNTRAPYRGHIQLQDHQYPVDPVVNTPIDGTAVQAKFTILSLGGQQLPIFSNPRNIDYPNGRWTPATGTVDQAHLQRNRSYTEDYVEPDAALKDRLAAAPAWTGSGDDNFDARFLSLPVMPTGVTSLATRLTAGLSPYEAAKAISDYFTDGKNGFTYSLDAPPNDGRPPIVTFLDKKAGFCQQYAAAAAVLMRSAGLPARVVLGYTHRAPDESGSFTVTTSDAHAWVEVYFAGVGWEPFDPTPLSGSDAARAVGVPWAPHPDSSAGAPAGPTSEPSPGADNRGLNLPSVDPDSSVSAGPVSTVQGFFSWPVILGAIVLILLILLVTPRALRRRQRRHRLAMARSTGNPELLWLELAATAADRDALWPDTTTVGQVPSWLAARGFDARGQAVVTQVAQQVEADRFSARPVTELSKAFVESFAAALTRWAKRAERRERIVNNWLPRSLLPRRKGWMR